ncbi:MAG TPA: hypothetical protein VI564_07930 [Candidatus Nanoarchaeia archaeon]|nr:hypothetical protein [Candidatus Nanoarchaeia archaeon]
MVDFKEYPVLWNLLIAAGGGLGIAGLRHLVSAYTGKYSYSTNHDSRRLKDARKIGVQINDSIEMLANLETDYNRSREGERKDMPAVLREKLYQRAKMRSGDDLYRKRTDAESHGIDYVLAYSNSDARIGKSAESKLLAAAFALEFRNLNKQLEVYSAGTDLVKIDGADVSSILNLPPQTGFNFFHAVREINKLHSENPTYTLFLLNSDAEITDGRMQKSLIKRMEIKGDSVTAFVEIGSPRAPYRVRSFADLIGFKYYNISGNNFAASIQLSDIIKETSSQMRDSI